MKKLLIAAVLLSLASPVFAGSLHGAAYHGAKAAAKGAVKGSYAVVKAAGRAVKHL